MTKDELLNTEGAPCECCGQRMLKAAGCTWGHIVHKGELVPRIKYGDEGQPWGIPGGRCGDCGTLPGHYHHPGCDIERCPICGGQLISCPCDITDYALATIELKPDH